MDKEKIMRKLMRGGHSAARAEEIIKEAEASSNPEYILHYWGVK